MKIQNILKDKDVQIYLLECFNIQPINEKTRENNVNLLKSVCKFLKYFVMDNKVNQSLILNNFHVIMN